MNHQKIKRDLGYLLDQMELDTPVLVLYDSAVYLWRNHRWVDPASVESYKEYYVCVLDHELNPTFRHMVRV